MVVRVSPLAARSGKAVSVTLPCCVFQCPPCRGFTPTLMRVYERLRADGRNFEVVLVSSDRSEESYRTYVSTMPWLAVPYGDQRCASLTKHFGVQGQASYSLLALNSVFELLLRSMIFHVCFHPCKRFFSSVLSLGSVHGTLRLLQAFQP